MLDSAKKSDIRTIARLVHKYDHSRNDEVAKAYGYVSEKDLFKSNIGYQYEERLKLVTENEPVSDGCLICRMAKAKNRFVCANCMDKTARFRLSPAYHMADITDDIVGGDGFVRLKWTSLISEVFKDHTEEEAEKIFTYGTKDTTPDESEILSDWPTPWLYGRVFGILYLAYIIAYILCGEFWNNFMPMLIFLGNIVVPFSVIILFFELNAPRNISIAKIAKIFLIGGLSSILITELFIYFFGSMTFDGSFFKAIFIGLREETAKLIVIYYYISKLYKKSDEELNNKSRKKSEKIADIKSRKKTDGKSYNRRVYLLNGLLIGAVVGAGFAVFESCAYAFMPFMDNYNVDDLEIFGSIFKDSVSTIVFRGIFAPGTHIAFSAIIGYATVLSGEKKNYKLRFIFNRSFALLYLMSVMFHALWDTEITRNNLIFQNGLWELLKFMLIFFFIWVVILTLVDNGLDEINIINRDKKIKLMEKGTD